MLRCRIVPVSRRFWFAALAGAVLLAGPTARPRISVARPAFASDQAATLDPTIASLLRDQPDAAILRPVATDIDRDGDIDVVSSSAHSVVDVWINDGHGHFERQRQTETRGFDSGNTAINALPAGSGAVAVPGSKWHGPMPEARAVTAALTSIRVRAPAPSNVLPRGVRRYSPTRAPPAQSFA